MTLGKHLRKLIDRLDDDRLRQLAQYIGSELDRRRLEKTLDKIEVEIIQ